MLRFMNGDVWWVDEARGQKSGQQTRRICGPNDLLGVAGEAVDGIVHKTGTFESVTEWADATRKKLARAGDIGVQMAGNITVVGVPATEETLEIFNRYHGISGSFGRIVEEIRSLPHKAHPALDPAVIKLQRDDRQAIASRQDNPRRPASRLTLTPRPKPDASDVSEANTGAPHYEIRQLIAGGFENVWQEGARPQVFGSAEDARQAFEEHMEDCREAVQAGTMPDAPDASEFRLFTVARDGSVLEEEALEVPAVRSAPGM